MEGLDFPKGVSIRHKISKRVVELGFASRNISEVLARKSDWPEDIAPIQKGGTATLSIHVSPIDMATDIADQEKLLEDVFAAVVCTENHIRVYQVTESAKLAQW